MKKRLHVLFTSLMITALLLTGAVPSFTWDGAGAPGASLLPTAVLAADEEAGDESEQESEVLPAITIDESDAPKINGKCAIVMDLNTGTVIYEKNADKIIEPASLTKILNCMVVVETLPLDEVLTVQDDVETEGSCIWLEPGEEITVEELLYGMMLESGNDAAEVLGLAAGGGSLAAFSDMMNAKAKECGAEHTNYKNPNGLNEDRTKLNYTTARDLALTARVAMDNKTFRKVVKTKKHTIPETNKSGERKLYNSNACLWIKDQKTEVNGREVPFKYKGCNGIKTGFTSDAGYCYVGSAKRDGTDFLVVTLGAEISEERYQDAIMLWDYAFGKYETCMAVKAGDAAGVQRVWGGEKRTVDVGTQRDLGVTVYKGTSAAQEFNTQFRLDNEKAEAPIKKGQKMGEALVFAPSGQLVARDDLYALASVGEGGPLSRIGIADEDLPLAAAIAGGALLLILLIVLIAVLRKRRRRMRRRQVMRSELATMRTSGTGMTAKELTAVTGREEFVPIPKGPARVSDEELKAWSSTKKRPKQKPRKDETKERYSGSRFGGRTPRGGYGSDAASGRSAAPNADKAPKMQITPRTPFTTGTSGREPYLRDKPLSKDELNAMLDSTEVYDANQPRRHGKLTEEERRELMRRTRRPRSKQ